MIFHSTDKTHYIHLVCLFGFVSGGMLFGYGLCAVVGWWWTMQKVSISSTSSTTARQWYRYQWRHRGSIESLCRVFLEIPVDIDMTPLDVHGILNHLTDMTHFIHSVFGFGGYVVLIWLCVVGWWWTMQDVSISSIFSTTARQRYRWRHRESIESRCRVCLEIPVDIDMTPLDVHNLFESFD